MRDHGECIAATCPRCHNSVILHHVQLTVWFTLFFIPVIPYKRKRMLMCDICRWSRDIPASAAVASDEMNAITANWRSGTMTESDYAQSVDAYWSFVSNDGQRTQSRPSESDVEQNETFNPDA